MEDEEPCLALRGGQEAVHQQYPGLQADESDVWVGALHKPRQGHSSVDVNSMNPELHLSKTHLL